MPVGIFELIYSTILLHRRDGKYPSMDTLAQWLQMTYRAVHGRIQMAERLGIVAPFERKQGGKSAGVWFNLTAYGADLFSRCLNGEELVIFDKTCFFSKNPEARPPDTVRYIQRRKSVYYKQLREIAEGGITLHSG